MCGWCPISSHRAAALAIHVPALHFPAQSSSSLQVAHDTAAWQHVAVGVDPPVCLWMGTGEGEQPPLDAGMAWQHLPRGSTPRASHGVMMMVFTLEPALGNIPHGNNQPHGQRPARAPTSRKYALRSGRRPPPSTLPRLPATLCHGADLANVILQAHCPRHRLHCRRQPRAPPSRAACPRLGGRPMPIALPRGIAGALVRGTSGQPGPAPRGSQASVAPRAVPSGAPRALHLAHA